jgi:FkbM family methyltransferase
MDAELALILGVTRNLPRIKGAGVLANVLIRFYLRKSREPITIEVLGFRMRLDPSECVDANVLFYPQLYDHTEIRFLQKLLRPGDCFLDLGANIGFYSLCASRSVGASGAVIAVEADPVNYEKLSFNLRLNSANNVNALCVGVSDKRETLRLGLNTTGNRGGNSFLSKEPTESVLVDCRSLAELLELNGVREVSGAKFDIEGFEFRVLRQFFADVDRSFYPKFIIIEQNDSFIEKAGGNSVKLLMRNGYRILWSSGVNYVLVLT